MVGETLLESIPSTCNVFSWVHVVSAVLVTDVIDRVVGRSGFGIAGRCGVGKVVALAFVVSATLVVVVVVAAVVAAAVGADIIVVGRRCCWCW